MRRRSGSWQPPPTRNRAQARTLRSCWPDADVTGKRERNPIAALVRVLDAMAGMPGETIGIRDLARLVGVHPSSLQRTLEAAEEASLVTAEGGQWELGWELFRLAPS